MDKAEQLDIMLYSMNADMKEDVYDFIKDNDFLKEQFQNSCIFDRIMLLRYNLEDEILWIYNKLNYSWKISKAKKIDNDINLKTINDILIKDDYKAFEVLISKSHQKVQHSKAQQKNDGLEVQSLKTRLNDDTPKDIYNNNFCIHDTKISLLNLILFTDAIECFKIYIKLYPVEIKDIDFKQLSMSMSAKIFNNYIIKMLKKDDKEQAFKYSIIYRNNELFNSLIDGMTFKGNHIRYCIFNYNFNAMKQILNRIDKNKPLKLDIKEFNIDRFYMYSIYQEIFDFLINSEKIKFINYIYLLPYVSLDGFDKLLNRNEFNIRLVKDIYELFRNDLCIIISKNPSYEINRYHILDKYNCIVEMFKAFSEDKNYKFFDMIESDLDYDRHYHEYMLKFKMISMKMISNKFKNKHLSDIYYYCYDNQYISESTKQYVKALVENGCIDTGYEHECFTMILNNDV